MEPFYVYILKCSDGSYYTGQTDNLSHRIQQHVESHPAQGSYVSTRMPFKLVFVDGFETREEALTAERQIKNWSRKKKEALIVGGWEAVRGIWRK
jgi:predicted GIY-YIG superfamily endonuclease